MMAIEFNVPDISSLELRYVTESLGSGRLSGDGLFTKKCHALLGEIYGTTALLTHSCTAALEASVILADIGVGDEVIMPSYTFVSTANAVVLRGATPVFVDIRPDTLNIDETKIEAAITEKTKAIMVVHYAGVGCAMSEIGSLARERNLVVIEDAAQAHLAKYEGKALGTFGALGCLSFHETKNVVSGEGGALIVNDPSLVDRAQHIREKGTNRTAFLHGEVAKYEWIDIGSSFLPSDLLAALLLAQLERAEAITERRMAVWQRYHDGLKLLQEEGLVIRPSPPQQAAHNAHAYFIRGKDKAFSRELLSRLRADGIKASTHYVPLHSAPAGRRFARTSGDLWVTDLIADTSIRLPLFSGLAEADVDHVIERILAHSRNIAGPLGFRSNRQAL